MKARSPIKSAILSGALLLFCLAFGMRAQQTGNEWPTARWEAAGDCPGDVNLDGARDMLDLIRLLRHITNAQPLTGDGLANADVNKSGSVDLADAVRLRRHLVGLEPLPDCPAGTVPHIASITPQRGISGSTFTIHGANFGATPALNTVRFGNDEDPATIVSATSTQIVAVVPAYYNGGFYKEIRVTTGGKTSNAVFFVVDRFQASADISPLSELGGSIPPFLLSSKVDSGDLPIGRMIIAFNNAGFSTRGLAKGMSIGRGYVATSLGITAVGLVLVTDLVGDVISVAIDGSNGDQAGRLITGTIQPSGQGFVMDLTFQNNSQFINSQEAAITSSQVLLYFDPGFLVLPTAGTSWSVVSSLTSQKPTAGQSLAKEYSRQLSTVAVPPGSPIIAGIQPYKGSYRQEIDIVGSNFSSIAAENQVTFAGLSNTRVVAPVLTASGTTLTVLVPAGAVSGSVQVTRGAGTSNTHGFWMPFSPSLQVTPTNLTANTNVGLRLDLQETALQLATHGFLFTADRGSWNFAALVKDTKVGRITGRIGGWGAYYDIYVEENDGQGNAVLNFKSTSGELQSEAKLLLNNEPGGGATMEFVLLNESLATASLMLFNNSTGQLTFDALLFRNPGPGRLKIDTILSSAPAAPGLLRRTRAAIVQSITIP